MKNIKHKANGIILILMIIFLIVTSITAYSAKQEKKHISPITLSMLSVTDVLESIIRENHIKTLSNKVKEVASNTELEQTETESQSESDKKVEQEKVKDLAPVKKVEPINNTKSGNMKIVGYYSSWSAYSNYTPDKIDANKITHLNYAFANIGDDLRIALGDPEVDIANFQKIRTLKNTNKNLKSLISVGGWTWSGKFSDLALTEDSRTKFAKSAVEFILKHGFDGVDIDWEYPVSGGLSTNKTRPDDKKNFTLLLKTLRRELDEQGKKDGKDYLLTIAGAAGSSFVKNTELGILHQYIDYANIMAYDIHGNWDKFTDFNAPLYSTRTSPHSKWSINASIDGWLNAGFPVDKLVMGLPFYGYKYDKVANSNNGLHQSYSKGSSISYKDIASGYLNKAGFKRYFNGESKVPYLFNGSTFISYDDEESIALKAQYIKSKGLAGAMIWELSQDPNRVLLNSLYKGLQ